MMLLFLVLFILLGTKAQGATLKEGKLFEKALKEGACSLNYFKKLSKGELKEPFLNLFVWDCLEKRNYKLLSLAKEVKNPYSKVEVARALKELGKEEEALKVLKEVFKSTNRLDEEITLIAGKKVKELFTPEILRVKAWRAAKNRQVDLALFYLDYLKEDPLSTYLLAYTFLKAGKREIARELFKESKTPSSYYFLVYISKSLPEKVFWYQKLLSQKGKERLKERATVYLLDYLFRKDLGLFRLALRETKKAGLTKLYLYYRDRYRVYTKGCKVELASRAPQKWWKRACKGKGELPKGINFYSLLLNPPKSFPFSVKEGKKGLKLKDEGLKYLYKKGYCQILSLIDKKTPQTALLMYLCGEYRKGIIFGAPFKNRLNKYPYLLFVLYPKPSIFKGDLISLAIARQESLFHKRALSRSGAIGLMQIMPKTGREIAVRLKEKNYTTERLFEPELNYRFGSYYIHKLLKRFKLFPLAAAAYNCGPSRVKRALKSFGKVKGKGDLVLFTDVYLPFAETREYVKRTLVNLYYYSNLYGNGTEWKTFLKP